MGPSLEQLVQNLQSRHLNRWARGLMLLGFATVFVSEVLTPLGFAHGTLYIPFVLLSLLTPQRGWLLAAVAIPVLLTLLGLLTSPPAPAGFPEQMVLGNRLFSLVAIMATSALVWIAQAVLNHLLQAQQALQENHRLMAMAEHYAQLGGWRLDLASGHCHWSSEVARILGRPQEASVDLDTALSHYPPLFRTRARALLEACVERGEPFDEEMQIVRSNGDTVWIRNIGRPLCDAAGQIIGVQGALQEIEHIKSLEQALLDSENLFRQFADTLPLMIWTASPNGELNYRNPVVEAVTGGRSSVHLLSQSSGWLDMLHPDDRDRAARRWQESVVTGKPYECEYRIRANKDRYIWYLARAEAIRNEHGEIRAWFGSAADIDTVKQLEQASRDLARRLDETLEHISDGFVLLDHDWRFVYVNQKAAAMLGSARETLPGQSLWEVFPTIVGTDHERRLRQAMRNHEPDRFEAHYPVAERWFAINLQPGPQGLSIFFDDNTTQHQLMSQLQTSQRLEAIGRLTAGVAHDFNNLLTVIGGSTELALEDAPAPLRALLEQVRHAAQHGADLTYRLLAFARLQPLAPRAVDVAALLSTMKPLLLSAISDAIKLEVNADSDLWPAHADPIQLESAVLNLCLNANDAMPDGGRLRVRVANTRLDAAYAERNVEVVPGDYVMIMIADDGEGIAPEWLDRVVEPFFTTRKADGGSGLGLAMVYGFVRQSGGHFRISSVPEDGTTVSLYLPRSPDTTDVPELPRPDTPTPAPPPEGNEIILVVEDDTAVRQVAIAHLRSLGYQTLEAPNAEAALHMLAGDQPVDLLFTDIVMPGGMNGRHLADTARTIRPGLKVLYTSGYTENAISQHGALEPGVKLLTKPYRHSELAARVREALQ